jgi:hypothetical protein
MWIHSRSRARVKWLRICLRAHQGRRDQVNRPPYREPGSPVLNNSIKVSVKKKPKAAVGDRYDVILTYGGDRKIEVARVVKEILRSGS